MTTAEEREPATEVLLRFLRQIVTIDIESQVVRHGDLGAELSFADTEAGVRSVVHVANLLQQQDLDRLPVAEIEALTKLFRDHKAILQNMHDFTVGSGGTNFTQQQKSLVTKMNGASAVLHKKQLELLSWATALNSSTQLSAVVEDAELRLTKIDEAVVVADKALAAIDDKNTAADQVLSAIRSQSAQAGVATEVVTFSKRANAHKQSADFWLKFIIGFAAAAAIWVFVAPAAIPADGSDSEVLVAGAGRFVVLSLILFGVGYSGRNYSAARHNQIQNEHRADSLNVFDSFVQGASAPEVRDAVLMEATRSIFRSQQSGYLRRGSADSQSPSSVVEVVRTIGDRSSGSPS